MTTDQALTPAPQVGISDYGKADYRANLAAALEALSPETRRAYTRALRQYAQYCADHGWPVVPSADVLEAWAADMRGRGLAPRTVKQSLAAVRWAARKGRRWGVVDAATMADLNEVRVSGGAGVRLGRWLTLEELLRLIRSPRGTHAGAVRDRAVLAVLGCCGLRRVELARLTWAHLEERDGQPVALVNVRGKRDRVRSVAIPEVARPYVVAWLALYRRRQEVAPELPLFVNVKPGGRGTLTTQRLSGESVFRLVRSAATAAGLDIAPHDLRRTAAALWRAGGADLVAIRDGLGHENTGTTERYLATAAGPASAPLAMDRLNVRIDDKGQQ